MGRGDAVALSGRCQDGRAGPAVCRPCREWSEMYIRGPKAEISWYGKSDPAGARAMGQEELGELHGGMFASAWELPPRPSEHTDRKEGVFVVGSSPHGEVLLTLIFDRDKDNKTVPRGGMTTRWCEQSLMYACSNFELDLHITYNSTSHGALSFTSARHLPAEVSRRRHNGEFATHWQQ